MSDSTKPQPEPIISVALPSSQWLEALDAQPEAMGVLALKIAESFLVKHLHQHALPFLELAATKGNAQACKLLEDYKFTVGDNISAKTAASESFAEAIAAERQAPGDRSR